MPAPDSLPSARNVDIARLAILAAHVADAHGHALILRTSGGDHHLSVQGPALAGTAPSRAAPPARSA